MQCCVVLSNWSVNAQNCFKSRIARNVGARSKTQIMSELPKVAQHVKGLQTRISWKVDALNPLHCVRIQMENATSCLKIEGQLVWFQFVEVNSNLHLQVLKDSPPAASINNFHFF